MVPRRSEGVCPYLLLCTRTTAMATRDTRTANAANPGDSSSPPSSFSVSTTEVMTPMVLFQSDCIWKPDRVTTVPLEPR